MLIYLLAITKMKTSDLKNRLLGGTKDIKPAGVVYLTYNINKTSVDREPDFSDPAVIEAEHASIEGKITRSGLELNNPAILSGEDKYNLTKGSQIPRDEFDVIFDQVKSSVAAIATKMLSGAAYAEPLKGETPCNYCKHKAICRRRNA
jgi:ATP-dependent helicase/DNAse subunit B